MLVYDSEAYLCTGRPEVDVFDLITNTWSTFLTTYERTADDAAAGLGLWPYPDRKLYDSAMHIINGNLYVFGGTHGATRVGCNLFMMLDLSTRKWKRLSGTVMAGAVADLSCPGPRKTPSSWINKEADHIFIIFEEFDREGASVFKKPHGAECGYPYDDLWSYDIKAGRWKRERIVGNPPCARSEMACTYNPHLDKVIVFGGYSPALQTTYVGKKREFPYSYFADTFIYSPPTAGSTSAVSLSSSSPSYKSSDSPKWKHVLTRGFPTYRCQAQLVTDPDTGKIYLRKDIHSRTFGDLWQLRVDLPGGDFGGVNLDEEARIAKAGPWQRCFACGSAGSWKKCGGICNGYVFFCGPECLKDGWKEHKTSHNFRKKT